MAQEQTEQQEVKQENQGKQSRSSSKPKAVWVVHRNFRQRRQCESAYSTKTALLKAYPTLQKVTDSYYNDSDYKGNGVDAELVSFV